jgi:tRNA 2-thiouridine synthesizing protein A
MAGSGDTEWHHDRFIDTSGSRCPLPVLKARKILLAMDTGQRLVLLATDPMSKIDVPHFCAEAGHRLLATRTDGNEQRYLIEKV